MSKFGDLIHGKTTQKPVVETPVVEETPVVDTAPSSVEEPVDPEPLDLGSLSKDELEDAMEVFTTSVQMAHFEINV